MARKVEFEAAEKKVQVAEGTARKETEAHDLVCSSA